MIDRNIFTASSDTTNSYFEKWKDDFYELAYEGANLGANAIEGGARSDFGVDLGTVGPYRDIRDRILGDNYVRDQTLNPDPTNVSNKDNIPSRPIVTRVNKAIADIVDEAKKNSTDIVIIGAVIIGVLMVVSYAK